MMSGGDIVIMVGRIGRILLSSNASATDAPFIGAYWAPKCGQ